MNPETIFVTPDGDAGPEHELIPSLSIANLLQQREAVMTLFQEALDAVGDVAGLCGRRRMDDAIERLRSALAHVCLEAQGSG